MVIYKEDKVKKDGFITKRINYLLNKKLIWKKKRNLIINYDKEADVLYISFDALQKANDTEFFSDDIIVRKKIRK